MKKRLLAMFAALVLLLAGVCVTAFAAETEAELISGEVTIAADGIYQLEEDASGYITVEAGVSELTILGDGNAESNAVTIDCSAAPGIHLTLQDVDLYTDRDSVLSFSGEGNVLTAEGVCLLAGTDSEEAALIHVAEETELSIDGEGALYLYQGGSIRADFAEDAVSINEEEEMLYPCTVDLSELSSDAYTDATSSPSCDSSEGMLTQS